MGIKLDWEVESDLGRGSIAEDAEIVAAEQRRRTITTRALIVFAVIAILAGSIAAYRYKIVRDEKHRVLLLAVEAEALALRVGDETKFMNLQGPSQDWRTEQRMLFDQIMSMQERVVISGDILDLTMTSGEARVVVEMIVNGEPMEGVWLYQYFPDKGWRHTATENEPWSERIDVDSPFTFTYMAADQAAADNLKATLTTWWDEASQRTGVTDQPTLEIRLDQTEDTVRWRGGSVLVIPPSVFQEETRDRQYMRLATVLGRHWAEHVLYRNTSAGSSYVKDWAVDQLGAWIQVAFNIPPAEHSAFVYLTNIYGDQLVPDFLAAQQRERNVEIALQTAMFRNAPDEFGRDHFRNYLEAAMTMIKREERRNLGPSLEVAIFHEGPLSLDYQPDYNLSAFSLSAGVPGSIRVENVENFNGVMWVTASLYVDSGQFYGTGQGDVQKTTVLIPFRMVNGDYKLTTPDDDDWGARLSEQGALVTLRYTELDAQYFEGRVPQIEELYRMAAADFGIIQPPPIEVNVRSGDFGSGIVIETDTIMPFISSPHLSCCSPGSELSDVVDNTLPYEIYRAVYLYQAGPYMDIEMSMRNFIFDQAIVTAAMQYRGLLESAPGSGSGSLDGAVRIPASVYELWDDSFPNTAQLEVWRMGATELVLLLLDRYGGEALMSLTQNIRGSASLDEWLQSSVGITGADVEDEWRARFNQAVVNRFGLTVP